MEFDPAITLRVAAVLLLIAVCLGAFYAARDWWSRVSEEDLAEEVHSRLEAIGREIALLATQIRHLEEVEGLQREVARLRGENRDEGTSAATSGTAPRLIRASSGRNRSAGCHTPPRARRR